LEGLAFWPNDGETSRGTAGAVFIGKDGTSIFDHGGWTFALRPVIAASMSADRSRGTATSAN